MLGKDYYRGVCVRQIINENFNVIFLDIVMFVVFVSFFLNSLFVVTYFPILNK